LITQEINSTGRRDDEPILATADGHATALRLTLIRGGGRVPGCWPANPAEAAAG